LVAIVAVMAVVAALLHKRSGRNKVVMTVLARYFVGDMAVRK
jgi:hypothetical protein